MTEFFLPFLIGYGVCRVTMFMLSSNKETSTIRKDNVILKWDNDSFAWRPCPLSSATEGGRYMIAANIDFEVLNFIRKNSVENE